MGAGLRRLPTVLLVTLVLGLVAGIAIALFTVVGGAIAVVAGMAIGGATALVSFLLGAFILWGAARLLLIWPLIAERAPRSEEHTSELQSLMRISYAVFCLKKKKKNTQI